MDAWTQIIELAGTQYGLIERGQAEALGMSPRTLNRRAAVEGWSRLHSGVLALPGSVDAPERRILAAALAVQGDAWATRWTAAYLWGLTDRLRVPTTLLVPHGHRAAALAGVDIVRTRNLAPHDVARRHGIPVVCPTRMIADLAPVCTLGELRGMAIDARQKRVLDTALLWELWERFAASPRHARLGAVAKEVVGQEERVDSVLERQVRALLRKASLPVPHPEPFPVEAAGRVVARIDIAWPRWRVGMECDGFRHHSERRQLDRDTERQNRLVALGWTIIRVTWNQVNQDPDGLTRLVHKILADAGAV